LATVLSGIQKKGEQAVKNAGKPKIIVAGGGIGGLTAALSLIKRGFEVEIYEQAPILQEIGAGVQISANGMLVFHELGLATRVMEEAAHPERREIRMWNTGQAWTAFDLGTASVQTYGHPYVTMFRPDLLGILSDAVTTAVPGALRLGHRAVGCETVRARVILRFDDGSTAEGDALIGADGIHSVIRAGLHGSDNAEFTGLVAWRGVIPMADLPPRLARSVSSNWVGPGRHVVQYPLRRGTLMNFVGVVEREDWHEESWTTPGSHADMLADFAGWHEDVQTLIAAIPQPYLWALKLRRPLPSWSVGRVTLLGDACHPTLPFLAQGAVMAIEDGYILSRALEAHGMDVSAAFRALNRRGTNAHPASSTDRPTTRNAFTTRCWEIRRRRRPMWSASGRKTVCGSDMTGCTDTTLPPLPCDDVERIRSDKMRGQLAGGQPGRMRSVLAAGVLAPAGWAAAAEYPAHSVTVVNPFAAGGQSDPIGRIVNTHFQSVLGQPFVMETGSAPEAQSPASTSSVRHPKATPYCSVRR
jgi:salicylate hydroxylase